MTYCHGSGILPTDKLFRVSSSGIQELDPGLCEHELLKGTALAKAL